MPLPRASPPVLAILSALVEERTGLHYAPSDHAVLAARAAGRAEQAGFSSLLDYYYFLRYDPAAGPELAELLDALVVRETYFFREWAQIEVLAELCAERIAGGGRPRIWSAACSTGEEPLSIAMALAQRGLLDRAEIVASDVSPVALERARSGRWGARSLRDVKPPPESFERFLRREPDGGVRVDEGLRARIEWRRVNLVDDAEVAAVGPADFILCRNVLIYFSEATASRVVERLSRQLRPGGALFVGISESLLRFGTSLECEQRGDVFLYRERA